MAEEIQWDFETTSVTTGPHPLGLQRARLSKLGVTPIEKVFDLPTGSTVTVAGAVISRQRPPTAKGFTFMILEDETYYLPTALPPLFYERFERVLRDPQLIVQGRLEAPAEEKKGRTEGKYRSILIDKIWSMREVMNAPKVVHGASGFPGQNPRTGAATAYRSGAI